MDVRCPSGILFGKYLGDGLWEFCCRSNRCGHAPGVVAVHRFRIVDNRVELVDTDTFRDPRSVNESATC